MPHDYKKALKHLYNPPAKPTLVDVPAATYAAVRGSGDPNEEGGAYQQAINLLYGLSYTVRMAPKGGYTPQGYFEYVVPPLEGFWWIDGLSGMDYARKGEFQWISCIRLPEFVMPEVFAWAQAEAARKKKLDFSTVEMLTLEEGLCVQCMHVGPYDDEPATVAAMEAFMQAEGLLPDFSSARRHHEVYLGDPRKTAPEKLKTVIRHPVRRRA